MSNYIKNNLESIWNQTLSRISDSNFFDATLFKSFISKTSLYDINDNVATIVVPHKINQTIVGNADNIAFIEEQLSIVLDKKTTCQIVWKGNLQKQTRNSTKKQKFTLRDGIIGKYRFDNFIVGAKSNIAAYNAAWACSLNQGGAYNPIFIYGNSGLGKSHLLHAVGNYIKENHPEKRVLYISGSDFINLILNSFNEGTTEDIKNYLYELDYLMIDDIQLLAPSPKARDVFFSIYNNLFNNDKQILITSDIHPSELKGIEARLISRFSSGLSVKIDTPEFETALAILEKKIEDPQYQATLVEKEALVYIATQFASDVRRLEGALTELFFKSLINQPDVIDLNFAKEVFKENPIVKEEGDLTVLKIKKTVCEFYGLTRAQIESKSRTSVISNARHIAIYLCRKHLDMPFKQIGQEFGGRDHSTVMSSYDKITKMIKEKETFNQAIIQIEQRLGIS